MRQRHADCTLLGVLRDNYLWRYGGITSIQFYRHSHTHIHTRTRTHARSVWRNQPSRLEDLSHIQVPINTIRSIFVFDSFVTAGNIAANRTNASTWINEKPLRWWRVWGQSQMVSVLWTMASQACMVSWALVVGWSKCCGPTLSRVFEVLEILRTILLLASYGSLEHSKFISGFKKKCKHKIWAYWGLSLN